MRIFLYFFLSWKWFPIEIRCNCWESKLTTAIVFCYKHFEPLFKPTGGECKIKTYSFGWEFLWTRHFSVELCKEWIQGSHTTAADLWTATPLSMTTELEPHQQLCKSNTHCLLCFRTLDLYAIVKVRQTNTLWVVNPNLQLSEKNPGKNNKQGTVCTFLTITLYYINNVHICHLSSEDP